MCFLHRLFDGPETDIIPLGDLDKILDRKENFKQEAISGCLGFGGWEFICTCLELFLNGQPQLVDPGLDALREL